jgi:nitroreductase
MLPTASVALFVCGEPESAHDRQISYMLQDCSAAVQNILLAAHGLGLGAVWLGIHPREHRVAATRKALGLPSSVVPVAGIAIGRPGEEKPPRSRYNAALVHFEKW